MINLLEKVFENSGFWSDSEIKDCIDKENDGFKVYVNDLDEMYFLVQDELDGALLERIISLCANAESNVKIKKRYKSNWVVVVVTKIQGELDWNQRKEIMLTEENKYFCRKYVFWYDEEEKTEMEDLCDADYSLQNIDKIIKNKDSFASFKSGNNIGYGCLSRIIIKLPFLNLSTMDEMDKTFKNYVEENVEALSEGLYEKLCNNDLAQIEECIKLEEADERDIKNRIKALEMGE